MKSTKVMAVLALSLALSASAKAQSRGSEVPPSHRPPPGMCRIWIDGVPANQQPAPTDCATAVRNRPEHGRVIFGDDYVKQNGQELPKLVRPFTETPRKDKRDTTSKPKKP